MLGCHHGALPKIPSVDIIESNSPRIVIIQLGKAFELGSDQNTCDDNILCIVAVIFVRPRVGIYILECFINRACRVVIDNNP